MFISFVLKPCGVDFILRGYVAKNVDDKIEKRLVSDNVNAEHFMGLDFVVRYQNDIKCPAKNFLSQ